MGEGKGGMVTECEGENTCSGKNIKFNLKKSFCAKQIIPLAVFLTSFKCTFANYTLSGTIK